MAGKRLSFQLGMIPAVVAAIVIGALVSDAFLTPGNLLNVLQQSAELAILVIAETLILLTGKFDLSLESVVGFAPMLAAWLVLPSVLGGTEAIPAATGLIVLFGVGAAVGLLNGLMVTRLRLNAFITTLAVLILLRGATLGVADGRTLANLPPAFTYLGSTSFVGLPFTVWIAAVLFAGVHLFLNYHRHGRAIYAVGGNPVAAHAAGIRVSRTVLAVFVVAGVLAALAGLLLTGRLAAVTAGQGQKHDLHRLRGRRDRGDQPQRRPRLRPRGAAGRPPARRHLQHPHAVADLDVLDRRRERRDHPRRSPHPACDGREERRDLSGVRSPRQARKAFVVPAVSGHMII